MPNKTAVEYKTRREHYYDWNEFVIENGPESGAFLQSWEWGDVLRSEGKSVSRFLRHQDDKTKRVQCLYERKKILKLFRTVYVPRGPIGATSLIEAKQVVAMVEQEKHSSLAPIFLKFELPRKIEVAESEVVKDIQPSTTLITDLDSTEDSLLSAMHHKTRYNVRLAAKKGVSISLDGYIDEFMKLISSTARRHKVTFGSKAHYIAILKHLNGEGDAPRAFLAKAEHDGDVIAMALCIDFGKTRTYLHGASSDVKKNMMAPFLLHWELMKDAKKAGLTAYDWWGIAPDGVEGHRLAGVTRFKKGFGGRVVSYPETRDVIIRPWAYRLYRFLKKFR